MAGNGGDWQTIPEAARLLRKSTRTIYRWAREGRIPVRRDAAPIAARMAPASIQELEALQRRVQELEVNRNYLQNALAASLTNTHRLPEAPRRRWRWPWRRQEGPS